MTTMTSELPLSGLVQRTHAGGLSFRQMEDRARRAGHRISHSQLAAFASNGVAKMPDIAQMRALAAALDVGYEAVRTAAFQQYYDYVPREVAQRQASRVAAAIPDDLSDEEERELARMVRAWAAARHSEG